MGQVATLMYALTVTATTLILCGHYDATKAQSDEVARLAEEKGAPYGMSGTEETCFSASARN